MNQPSSPRPVPSWSIPLALFYLYIAWGTTYLAIKKGVREEQLPPALFAGSRVCLAGVLLLGFLYWRGYRLGLCGRDFCKILLVGCLFFIGGNGLLTAAEKTVPSGVASILAATTPIWVAMIEAFLPKGDRLNLAGWLGLLIGLVGVILLIIPELTAAQAAMLFDPGPLFMLGSTLSWAVGILLLRYGRTECDPLVSTGYQMMLGGGALTLLGLGIGEWHQLPAEATIGAVGTFLYLLVFGSLIGYLAFTFLLRHVSAAMVGTHAYVNPIVAILIGCLLDKEEMTGWIVAGILSVLVGVFLVRTCHKAKMSMKRIKPVPGNNHPLPVPEWSDASARR